MVRGKKQTENRLASRLNQMDPERYRETHGKGQTKTTRSMENSRLYQNLERAEREENQEPKKRSIKDRLTEPIKQDEPEPMQEFDDPEIVELMEIRKQKEEERRWSLMTSCINVFLVIACIYVVFLIYGVSVTDYSYNEDGEIEALKMSVSDIREKKNFSTISSQYLKLRTIYEKVLLLDYRYANSDESMESLGTEYNELTSEIEDLSTETNGIIVDDKYSQVKDMMYYWLADETYSLGNYCALMSAGLSQNNSDYLNSALEIQTTVNSYFGQITSNIVSIGEELNGVDLSDIKNWSSETYVNETINSTS